MKTTKHWLATIAVLLCSVSVSAHDFEVDGIYYKYIDEVNKTVEVTCQGKYAWDYDNEYAGHVIIPEKVNYNNQTYVVIKIGDWAFRGCSGLSGITLPNSITSIGEQAFLSCSGLSSITIPSSVTNIGLSAFSGCIGLNSVVISDLGAWCNIDFSGPDSNPLYYAVWLWLNNELLQEIIIPNDVKEIKRYAFYNYESLYSIKNTGSLERIGKYAFYNCANLFYIDFGDNVESIEDYAFSYCCELTNLVLSEKLKTIGFYAFRGCGKITSLTIPSSVTYIGAHAFKNWAGLKELRIEDGIVPLCCGLGEDTYNSVDYFFENSPIEYLYVGRNLSGYTFSYPYGDWRSTLRTVEIGNGMTSIPNYMFDSCSKLSSVAISDNVKHIGKYAFFYCNNITSVAWPNGLISIGVAAFSGCSFAELIIPQSVTSIGLDAFKEDNELNSIVVESGNPIYDSRDNCNAIIETGTNVLIRGCKNTTIPYGITSIGNSAFYWCPELVEMEIPSSVISIGDYAFSCCYKFSSVTLPQGVTSIGNGAFSGCSALTSITCEAETPPVIGGAYTFSNVARNIPIYVPESSVSAYKSAEYWSEFTNFQAIPEINISLTDGEDFSQSEPEECDNIFYTRTFNNSNWQALYVPFEIPYENIKDDFEVAYINDTRQYDRDDDGVKEETVIEAFKITSGTLEANYPYLIRAKEAGEKTITLTDAILYATEENSIDCSSVYDKYTFTGTYSRMSSTELTGCYALSGGVWQPIAEGATLGAFRFYLQVESRSGSAQAAQSIKMRVIGEETDDEATSIDEVESADNEQIVYDLAGRRVANPTKGVYIVNGKKMLYN